MTELQFFMLTACFGVALGLTLGSLWIVISIAVDSTSKKKNNGKK